LIEQNCKDAIATIPELGKAVKEFVIEEKERSELVRKHNRLAKLREHLPKMKPDELRSAWKVYRDADERSLIQAQAARIGLLGEEFKDAQLKIDEEAKLNHDNT